MEKSFDEQNLLERKVTQLETRFAQLDQLDHDSQHNTQFDAIRMSANIFDSQFDSIDAIFSRIK
jgi:hypothetical protein